MARWTLDGIVGDPVIEHRWFGRWLTPRWIDLPMHRLRDYRTDPWWQKLNDFVSDRIVHRWLVRWDEVDE